MKKAIRATTILADAKPLKGSDDYDARLEVWQRSVEELQDFLTALPFQITARKGMRGQIGVSYGVLLHRGQPDKKITKLR